MANQSFKVAINAVNLTTAERDALTPLEGDQIYNTTTKQYEFYNGSQWVSGGGGLSFGDVWALNTLISC